MFSIFSTVDNALSTAKALAIAMMLLIAFGTGTVFLYKYHNAEKKVEVLTNKVTEAVGKAQDMKKLVDAQPASNEVTDKAEIANNKNEKKVIQKHQQTIAKVIDKVENIKKDPAIPEVEKDKQIANTYIDQLWADYCDAGVDDPKCPVSS